MAWTESRVATVEKLWGEGLSAAEIAKRLGDTTRNAVIGVVHRKGWQRGGHQGAVGVVERKARAPSPPKPIVPPRPPVAAQPLRIKRAPIAKAVQAPSKAGPKFDASPASLAAMALIGQAHSAQARRDGYRATRP